MAGKKGKGRKPHRRAPIPTPEESISLPVDVITNILSRLSVKTLLDFRCVSKQWKALIRSPKFISFHLHHHHHHNAATSSLLVQTRHFISQDQNLAIFSPLASSKLVKISHYFPRTFMEMDVIGTVNGVVCVSLPPLGSYISIFNPLMKHHRALQRSFAKNDHELFDKVTVGFGHDPAMNCYKVICILCFKDGIVGDGPDLKRVEIDAEVQLYNLSSNSWKKLDLKEWLPYKFVKTKCDLIVNGVPYWMALLESESCPVVSYVLVGFDVQNEAFHHILLEPLDAGTSLVRIVDWNGKLAMLTTPRTESQLIPLIDVWVMGDGGGDEDWFRHKRIDLPQIEVRWTLGCSRNGQIMGWDDQGNLFLYVPETGRVDKLSVGDDFQLNMDIFNYTESLVWIKGENPVGKLPMEDYVSDAKKRYLLFNFSTLYHICYDFLFFLICLKQLFALLKLFFGTFTK